MELWFTEKQLTEEGTSTVSLSVRVKEVLHREQTSFQEIAVIDTYEFGRMLVLDGIIQLTTADEFFYHEMIAHVPMRTHPSPQHVLVVGGGDGGTLRELLKYPQVQKVTLAEIDRKVIDASRKYLPQLGGSFDDPRVEIKIINGIEYVNSQEDRFDVVIIDSPDPLGPAKDLFEGDFYKGVCKALKDDGIMTAQSESPVYNRKLIRRVCHNIRQTFPHFYYYLAPVPIYPSGLWSYAVGSKHYSPLQPQSQFTPENLRYYTPQIHLNSFVLPPFVLEIFTGPGGE